MSSGSWLIHSIHLYGGHIEFNAIPGALNGVAINIEGVLLELDTIPVGSLNAIGEQEDHLLNLSGTALSLSRRAGYIAFPHHCFDRPSISSRWRARGRRGTGAALTSRDGEVLDLLEIRSGMHPSV